MGKVWGIGYFCSMATIKFIIRSDSETASIYVRFKEGRLIDLTAKTNFIINSKDWSITKGQPKNLNDASLKRLNNDLTIFKTNLLSHYNKTLNKVEVANQWLKNFINPPQQTDAITNKLVAYFDYYIKHKTELKPSGITKLKGIKHLLERFQIASKSVFIISDVNANFKLSFDDFCKSEMYAPNTISRAFKFVKTICYHARNNNIETSPQLDALTTKNLKVEKVYLTKDELNLVEKVILPNNYLNNARQWLLISCETGQRVSDFLRFTKDMIRYEGGKPLIEFTQRKTNKIMTVPLSKCVIKILESNGGDFPHTLSDQRYNDYIKEVCKLANLTQKVKGSKPETKEGITRKQSGVFEKWELVTSHIGRRSFATNNYGIIPTSLLIAATGHSTEKMFLEYIGKTDTQKALQLADYF